MSLTGLFLILFLIVHLLGNLQLLMNDGGEAFNTYAYLMVHNPVIKLVSYGLYFFILVHTVQGILITIRNRQARPRKYAVGNYPEASPVSKQMALLGILIFAFLCIHMGDFWYKMKFTSELNTLTYPDFNHTVQDLYTRVAVAYEQPTIVIIYLIGMIALAFHLWHGFESAFQTLGLTHKRYGFLLKWIGRGYSVLIPAAFALIPVYMYFID